MAPNFPRVGLKDDRRPSLFFRPQVEPLEDRYTPATVTSLKDAGAGTLRDAINSTAAGGTVDFAVGLVGTITLTSELAINKPLTISGPGNSSTGAPLITISGNGVNRIFNISNNAVSVIDVTIEKLLLTKGRATLDLGGGILLANE